MGEEEKKEEEKKEEEEIVLKVEMHCEACARKVARSLRGFQGVEEVTADCKASKVVVKGKTADPIKVCERIQRKSGKKVEIISPLPKPPTQEDKAKEEETKEPQEEKKDQPPAVVTVVLKVGMHCDACAQALQKRIRKIQGVESVTTDIANDQVMVTGIIDPTKLVDDVYKKTRKQASIVVNKEEEKKDNDNNQQQPEANQKKEEEEKKEEVKGEEELLHEHQNMMMEIKKNEHWPSKYMDLHHHNAYPPQIFSDENPHACSLM